MFITNLLLFINKCDWVLNNSNKMEWFKMKCGIISHPSRNCCRSCRMWHNNSHRIYFCRSLHGSARAEVRISLWGFWITFVLRYSTLKVFDTILIMPQVKKYKYQPNLLCSSVSSSLHHPWPKTNITFSQRDSPFKTNLKIKLWLQERNWLQYEMKACKSWPCDDER